MKKSHTAGWVSDSPTPAQLKEFFSQVESGRITKRKLQGFLRSGQVFKNDDAARLILGDNIIFPDEVAEARGFSYTENQLRHFAETLPANEILQALKANNFALVAGPPSPMSLLDVRQTESGLFHSKTGGWYENQKFAKDDKILTEWLAIRQEPVPNSTNRKWSDQLELIKSEERVPNAGEIGWFITTFFKVRGVRLFESVYVRTSSVDSDGYRVLVGIFDSGGLFVCSYWDDDRNVIIGVASARKLS
jgi:hypothetical protein